MNIKISNSSILDFLFRDKNASPFKLLGDPKGKASQTLYSLFKSAEGGVEPMTFKRPTGLRADDLIELERYGLVEWRGDMIKITTSGRRLLEAAILNEDDCVFMTRNPVKADQYLK